MWPYNPATIVIVPKHEDSRRNARMRALENALACRPLGA
jgi:hypothetical protein